MKLLHYVEIENFKRFDTKQRIELDHPTVLIGPNNCGKTSAIQALALWSQAFRAWFSIRSRGSARQRRGIPLNRLEIVAVPVQTTKYFWSNVQVRKGSNRPIYLVIAVGVEFEGAVVQLSMSFYNDGDDLVYCQVKEEESFNGLTADQRARFMEHVAGIRVELLYPMSGLSTTEPVYQDRFIANLMGQGRTAEVLRNLCRNVAVDKWVSVQRLISRLFQVDLSQPEENAQGHIELYYSPKGRQRERLELAASGRGFQQMLLILAHLYSHPGGVLLIDEPDAHLEILRQKEMYVLLRDIATENESQVVMVTHSEVILTEAVDRNLNLILDGRVEDISQNNALQSLKLYGTEHYVKARERRYVFYTEGSTDVDMLRELARKLGHPVFEKWDERLNSYYVQNNYPETSLESELDRAGMGYGFKPREHFFWLRDLMPSLRGLAILDNDGQNRQDSADGGLRVSYWQRYEAENYFISPELLRQFSIDYYGAESLFSTVIDDVLDNLVIEQVFRGSEVDFRIWRDAAADVARVLWQRATERIKLSAFAEEFFRRLAARLGMPMILRKGELHRLIAMIDASSIANEVTEKLDLLMSILTAAAEGAPDPTISASTHDPDL
jgi:ABC-type cobalamin/Fe3+-siderophores transport system ATPase subunit